MIHGIVGLFITQSGHPTITPLTTETTHYISQGSSYSHKETNYMIGESTIQKILEILVPTLIAIGALITALANRKVPVNDENRTKTEAFSAQLSASKTLADSSRELVGISQDLIKRIEEELTEITAKNHEMEAQIFSMKKVESQVLALQAESEFLKISIEGLKRENTRMVAISKQLINGIGVLLV